MERASANNLLERKYFLPSLTNKIDNPTHIRIRVVIPKHYHQQPVISQLTADYGLVVNITAAMLSSTGTNCQGWFDLELRGDLQQICDGLSYLESLQLKIQGKPNTDGDGWYC